MVRIGEDQNVRDRESEAHAGASPRISPLVGLRKGKWRGALPVGALAAWIGLTVIGHAATGSSSKSDKSASTGAGLSLPDAPAPRTAKPASAEEGTLAQSTQAGPVIANPPGSLVGSLHGVVVCRDGAACEGVHVSLAGTGPGSINRQALTDGNGRYSFANLPAGTFKLTVNQTGFATQTATVALQPGESLETKELILTMSGTSSEVEVTASSTEIAAAELKVEETQRVLGFMPNFYVSYAPNPLPLTRRQKFSLAWKTAVDPATFVATGVVAGIVQATNGLSGYGQGMQGYAKRYGAGYADNVIGTMIGGGILASWWKQDPRYFYQGTGSKRSRAWHAISRAVLCSGDNGKTQVNYSAILGGLAAGGIANLYYPDTDRDSAGLLFQNTLIGTGASAAANLLQEFVVRRLTPKVPNYGAGKTDAPSPSISAPAAR
jgi:hypothetical protein